MIWEIGEGAFLIRLIQMGFRQHEVFAYRLRIFGIRRFDNTKYFKNRGVLSNYLHNL